MKTSKIKKINVTVMIGNSPSIGQYIETPEGENATIINVEDIGFGFYSLSVLLHENKTW